jgi:DNA-directed RNA polymerase specialized sigma24 family protein
MSLEYLNNRVFEGLIDSYKKTQKKRAAKPTDFEKSQKVLAEAFYILAENIIRAFKFQMIDRDDMLQEGVMICFEKLNRFDPNYTTVHGTKSKAFNYFTTCTLNHFRQLYRTAKNYKQLKERYYDFLSKKNTERVLGQIASLAPSHDEDD